MLNDLISSDANGIWDILQIYSNMIYCNTTSIICNTTKYLPITIYDLPNKGT